MRRILPVLTIVTALVFGLSACAGGGFNSANTKGRGGFSGDKTITIGSTNFSEQLLVANMYAHLLEKNGYKVNKRLNLGNREIVMPAVTSGQLDLIPEYTGAMMLFFDKNATKTSPQDVAEAVRATKPSGTEMLEPSKAEDKDALAVTQTTADTYKLKKVSDLTPDVAKQLVIGGAPEMKERQQGLAGYKRVYGIEFKEFKALDAGGPVTVAAMDKGEVQVGEVFTTQGVLKSKKWVVLEDDKNLQPAQQIVPFGSQNKLDDQVKGVLNRCSAVLTTDDLIELNAKIDIEKQDPDQVAAEWLKAKGLV